MAELHEKAMEISKADEDAQKQESIALTMDLPEFLIDDISALSKKGVLKGPRILSK